MPRVKPKGLSNIAEFCPFYISLCNIHIAPLSPSNIHIAWCNMNIALVHVSSPILHCQLLWWPHPPWYKSWCSNYFPAGDSLFGKQVTCAGERIPSVHTLFIPPHWWKMVTRQYHILSARGNWISGWFDTVGGFDNIQRESSRAVCTSIISAPVSAGSISWFHWLWAVFGDGREQVGGCSPFNQ